VIRRILALAVILWLLGFALFVVSLPGPADQTSTDAIIALTGGKGRIDRGIVLLSAGKARRLLVSGVDPAVRPGELAAVLHASPSLFACCIDLGKEAIDTRTNAEESARWIRRHDFHTVRLVTTDWHMPRARFELTRELGDDAEITSDAVSSAPGLPVLMAEYNKYWLRRLSALFGG
jgi:uncharacterized SAM-binding protein YcdF (DUF218 family)